MEQLKPLANADLAADVRLEKWAGTQQEIEEPFEQTVDPSQLDFDFGRIDPKKRDEDESGSSECSESSSDSYEIDDTVMLEMHNLEDIFQNMGFSFRMIDRIGEGEEGCLGLSTDGLMLRSSRNFLHCI